MESTEHLISRLTRERDEAFAAVEAHRRAGSQRALVAADRMLGAHGIPWWITLEATLRVVVSSWELRDHPMIGSRVTASAIAGAAALLERIDRAMPDRRQE